MTVTYVLELSPDIKGFFGVLVFLAVVYVIMFKN